jgi:hypothetical protein
MRRMPRAELHVGALERTNTTVDELRENPYRFLSGATGTSSYVH